MGATLDKYRERRRGERSTKKKTFTGNILIKSSVREERYFKIPHRETLVKETISNRNPFE